MPEIREVHVAFKKMVSDGDYGNETFEVGVTASPGPDEAWLDVASHLAGLARDTVLFHLSASKNEAVREALETRDEREARWKRESERRRREVDEQRAAASPPKAEGGQDERPF